MVLKVKNVKKNFSKGFFKKKITVLQDISFEVNKGEVFGIIGPNGAGKTTTFKCILNFIKIDSGHIEILGKPYLDHHTKTKIGYLPENPYFYEYLTGYELLKYMGSLHGIKGNKLTHQIDYLLEKVNLTKSSNIQLRKYSKGMLQRIAIAQCLVNNPELLILDEPMSGLDPLGRKEVNELINDLKRDGKTVILSSHILTDLENLCDRVCFIFNGKVITTGNIFEVFSMSESEYEAIIRKNSKKNIKFDKRTYSELNESKEYISIKFNNTNKKEILNTILSNELDLISIHPKRESLEYLFEKQIKLSTSQGLS